MAGSSILPAAQAVLVDRAGRATVPFYDFMRRLTGEADPIPPDISGASFVTLNNESDVLPNSVHLVEGENITLTQNGDALIIAAEGSDPTAILSRGATFVSGGALALPVNDVPVRIPIACTITKVTVLTLGGTGSCVIDIWKDTYTNYPPTVADSICASAKPTIATGIKYEDSTLTGWTTAVAAGDVLMFHLESTSIFNTIAISLEFQP